MLTQDEIQTIFVLEAAARIAKLNAEADELFALHDQGLATQQDKTKISICLLVESFLKNIPTNQQYGITIWGVRDSPEDSNWLPGEMQALWNINFQRKHAYKGFCDGLAGKDVSDDFSGELQY